MQTKTSHPLYQGRVMVLALSTKSTTSVDTSNIPANITKSVVLSVYNLDWSVCPGRKFANKLV